MASRIDLQYKLENILGSKNVYYQPPSNIEMNYPAIRYSRSGISKKTANNTSYNIIKKYELIVISRRPDEPVLDELLKLEMCSHNRHYVSNNLHHDVFTIYF